MHRRNARNNPVEAPPTPWEQHRLRADRALSILRKTCSKAVEGSLSLDRRSTDTARTV